MTERPDLDLDPTKQREELAKSVWERRRAYLAQVRATLKAAKGKTR